MYFGSTQHTRKPPTTNHLEAAHEAAPLALTSSYTSGRQNRKPKTEIEIHPHPRRVREKQRALYKQLLAGRYSTGVVEYY